MSGIWRKTLVYLGLVEEPDDHDDPDLVHGGEPSLIDDGDRPRRSPRPDPSATVRPLRPADTGGTHVRAVAATSVRVTVVRAGSFDDAETIGARYRTGQPVLLDLTAVDTRTGRRLLDFVGGVTFALRGRIAPAGDRSFLLVPEGVEVPPDERGRLAELGYRPQLPPSTPR